MNCMPAGSRLHVLEDLLLGCAEAGNKAGEDGPEVGIGGEGGHVLPKECHKGGEAVPGLGLQLPHPRHVLLRRLPHSTSASQCNQLLTRQLLVCKA